MEDPLEELKKSCSISSSQEVILSHSNFAPQNDFPSFSGDAWPEFSSSSSSSSSDDDASYAVTICSAPETPESHQKEDDDATPTTTNSQPEEFKTPPEIAAPNSASSDDVVFVAQKSIDSPELGFSEEREITAEKREREEEEEEESEIAPSAKKLKGSDDLGFMEAAQQNVEQTRNGVEGRNGEMEDEKLGVTAEMSEKGRLKLQLNLEVNANLKEDELKLMKFLMDALMKVSRGIQKGGEDEPVDIFETAKERGMTFPRSRWYERE